MYIYKESWFRYMQILQWQNTQYTFTDPGFKPVIRKKAIHKLE